MELNVESYPLLVSFTLRACFICGDISTKKEKKRKPQDWTPTGHRGPIVSGQGQGGGKLKRLRCEIVTE